jgi:hypothetical protein
MTRRPLRMLGRCIAVDRRLENETAYEGARTMPPGDGAGGAVRASGALPRSRCAGHLSARHPLSLRTSVSDTCCNAQVAAIAYRGSHSQTPFTHDGVPGRHLCCAPALAPRERSCRLSVSARSGGPRGLERAWTSLPALTSPPSLRHDESAQPISFQSDATRCACPFQALLMHPVMIAYGGRTTCRTARLLGWKQKPKEDLVGGLMSRRFAQVMGGWN